MKPQWGRSPAGSPHFGLNAMKGVVCMNTKSILKSGVVLGIIAIVAGVLVLIRPELVQWIIGIFLIAWGVLAIINKR